MGSAHVHYYASSGRSLAAVRRLYPGHPFAHSFEQAKIARTAVRDCPKAMPKLGPQNAYARPVVQLHDFMGTPGDVPQLGYGRKLSDLHDVTRPLHAPTDSVYVETDPYGPRNTYYGRKKTDLHITDRSENKVDQAAANGFPTYL